MEDFRPLGVLFTFTQLSLASTSFPHAREALTPLLQLPVH